MTVIQQLEATRRQAEETLPDRVEEAVGLAFERLMESGVLAPHGADGEPVTVVPAPAAAAPAAAFGTVMLTKSLG